MTQFDTVSGYDGLVFTGIFGDERRIIVHITGDLNNISTKIYVTNTYSLNQLVDNFRNLDVEIMVEILKSPYMVICFIPKKKPEGSF